MTSFVSERWVVAWLVAAASAVLSMAPAQAAPAGAPSHQARAAKQPDLVVTAGALDATLPYAFNGRKIEISTRDTTRNRGNASAGRSVTTVFLKHGSDPRKFRLFGREVPRLGPSKEHTGNAASPFGEYRYLPGSYSVIVCADTNHRIAESNEDNNCGRITIPFDDPHFYVAQEFWVGRVSGFYGSGVGDQMERWTSTDAAFDYDRYLGDGLFLYQFDGTVSWKDTGSSGGCSWSGSGTRAFGPGAAKAHGTGLLVDYEDQRYYGHADVDRQFYKTRVQCGSSGGNAPAPFISQFWDSADSSDNPRPFPFGTRRLEGDRHLPAPTLTWTWDLRAAEADD